MMPPETLKLRVLDAIGLDDGEEILPTLAEALDRRAIRARQARERRRAVEIEIDEVLDGFLLAVAVTQDRIGLDGPVRDLCAMRAKVGSQRIGKRAFDGMKDNDTAMAIDRDPSNPDGYYNLAAAYHRMGLLNGHAADMTQAERYYYLCLDRDPEHRECYRGLSVLLVEQNRTEEAFRLLQSWADRRPNAPDPKIELARLYEEVGDRDRAKQQLADALQVDAANSRALAAMGRLREQDGDRAQALNNYQQSLASNRFQPDVATRVTSLQSSMGGTPAATAFSQGPQTVSRGPSPVR